LAGISSQIVPKTPCVIVRKGKLYFAIWVPVDVLGAH
jgi:hypothetical protein